METLNCKRKERRGWRRRRGWWRGRVTDDKIDLIWLIWENKIERTASHSMESNSVVSKCVSLLISVPSYQWGLICFKIRILSTKSANHKICQPVTILCLTLPFHSSEIWVSRANCDACTDVLLWKVARLLVVAILLMLCLQQRHRQQYHREEERLQNVSISAFSLIQHQMLMLTKVMTCAEK